MDYSNVVTYQSAIPEFQGVSFTLRKISHGLRAKIRYQLLTPLNSIRTKVEIIQDMLDTHGLNKPEETPAQMELIEEIIEPGEKTFDLKQSQAIARINDINNEIQIAQAKEVDPVWLNRCFVSFNGTFLIDGKEPAIDEFYESGPEDLCLEIMERIKQEAGLSPKVKENLE